MSWYYNAATGEAKQLDDALYAAWVAANNPKADAYALIPDPPASNAHYDGSQWQVWEPTLEQRRAQMSCTPRQARLALTQAGLLEAIEAWVAAAAETTQIEWQYANEIRRDWTTITEAATALGLSDTQLDDLFTLAATL